MTNPITRASWKNLSWATKLTILLVALSIAPLIALTLYNRLSSRQELLDAARTNNLQRARGTAAVLDSYLESVAAELETSAISPWVVMLSKRARETHVTSDLTERLQDLHNIERFDQAFTLDTNGVVVAATSPQLVGKRFSARRWFLTAMAGETIVDDPERDEATGAFALHVSSPIRRPQQPILGVIVATIPMAALERYVAGDSNFGGSGEFGMLWNEAGIRLVHPTNPVHRFKPLRPLAPYSELLARRRFGPALGAFEGSFSLAPMVDRSRWLLYDHDADPYLRVEMPGAGAAEVAMVPLARKRWVYGIFTPEDQLVAELDARMRRDLGIAFLVGLIAIAVSLTAASRASRPLRLIGRTAHDVAAGNMSGRVRLRQADEVGQVAAAFDQMLDSVAAKDAQLQARADDLERRVQERTEELAGLYNEAQEANRLKDEFLGTVSHELRTPLNAILGWTRMLRTQGFDDRLGARALETIERNARSQAQLIDDLLDVSRIISGKLRLDVRSVDLGAMIGTAVDAIKPAADAKHIAVKVTVDPDVTGLLGDPGRLEQVVWNLLSNAIKFTPPRGSVSVGAGRAGDDSVEIRVSDTGAGIKPEFLPYVFERFRQADSSTTRMHGGLGLGLAIVRHLVELHGGTVRADSDGVGKGATFTVRLPESAHPAPERARDQPLAAPTPLVAPSLSALAGVRVLVVDDESDGRELAAAALERHGASVVVALSSTEALAAVARTHIDVVVADIGMPEEDGYSMVRRLRQHPNPQVRRIPALAVTAYAGEQDRRRAASAGFLRHLPKPMDPDELVRAVFDILASRSSPA